nr:type II toxin-antitoxin system HicA family toxin [uncultured Fusobacterium sp.]
MKLLKKDGWYLDRVKGSHYQFKHPSKKGIVILPHPEKIYQRKLLRVFSTNWVIMLCLGLNFKRSVIL